MKHPKHRQPRKAPVLAVIRDRFGGNVQVLKCDGDKPEQPLPFRKIHKRISVPSLGVAMSMVSA